MRPLRDLIDPDRVLGASGDLGVPVGRIVTDSREIQAGDVFVCLPGYCAEGGETRADRHEFIPVAVERGAAALIVERDGATPDGVTVVRVADAWSVVADMSCRYFGHPSRSMLVAGVTGTSGKTSTTYFIDAVLAAAGHRVARLGTIDYRIGDTVLPAAQTTPEAPLMQRLLRDAADAGCSAVVMEVSSHALELRRAAGIAFDVGVFTNLSRDHLNFHPDMEHYARAKGRLFEALGSGGKRGTAVLNVDDAASEYMIGVNRGDLVTYGLGPRAEIRARDVETTLRGVSFVAETPNGSVPIRLSHLGEYSVYNALAALAAGPARGLELDTIAAGLDAAPPVPGRFELVDAGQDFVVVVDYAHKPDALERLLRSARQLKPRRILTVFGCGGDRDHGKRPVMGRIAAELSDFAIVTSDNPRSENPDAIVADILAGVRSADPSASHHAAVVDRTAAIRRAVDMAETGDIVIIAGKGHEPYQLIAGRRLDFDDRREARDAIVTRLARR